MSLVIKPNIDKHTARIRGVVSVGEHVEVLVENCANLIAPGLRFRVMDVNGLCAFGDNFEANEDDLIFTLNLNTVQMCKRFKHVRQMNLYFVLDNPEQHQKYFSELHEVQNWVREEGTDVPTNLDDYPSRIEEINEKIDEAADEHEQLRTSVQNVENSLGSLSRTVNTFSDRIDTIRDNTSLLNVRANDIDDCIDAIEENMLGKTVASQTYATKTSLETAISNNAERHNEINDRISELASKVNSAKNAIDNIEDVLDDKQDTIVFGDGLLYINDVLKVDTDNLETKAHSNDRYNNLISIIIQNEVIFNHDVNKINERISNKQDAFNVGEGLQLSNGVLKSTTANYYETLTKVVSDIESVKQTVKGKADKERTLVGYGITNAYTKSEIDNKIAVIESKKQDAIALGNGLKKIDGYWVEVIGESVIKLSTDETLPPLPTFPFYVFYDEEDEDDVDFNIYQEPNKESATGYFIRFTSDPVMIYADKRWKNRVGCACGTKSHRLESSICIDTDVVATKDELNGKQDNLSQAQLDAIQCVITNDYKGEKGDTGATGPQGERGADGVDGKDGKDGLGADIEVGDGLTIAPAEDATDKPTLAVDETVARTNTEHVCIGKDAEVGSAAESKALAFGVPSADIAERDQDIANGGFASTALGRGAAASGFASTALGYGAAASKEYATALGRGAAASGFASTALGYGAAASKGSAIALGYGAAASGVSAIALGRGAQITNEAEDAVQIGMGTNDTANTLQFREYQLVDAAGIIPAARLPTIPAARLPTIPADRLPTIPADKLPTIPADKLPTIPAERLPTIPADKLPLGAFPIFYGANTITVMFAAVDVATTITLAQSGRTLTITTPQTYIFNEPIRIVASGTNLTISVIGTDGEAIPKSTWGDGGSGLNTSARVILTQAADCLAPDTLITLADGTTKRVDALQIDDALLAVNPETGGVGTDIVNYTDSAEPPKYGSAKDLWAFEDGTIVTTVKPHQFYNVRTGKMEYIADFQIGDRIRKADGTTPALTAHEHIEGETRHHTLYTAKWNNYFANGILTGNRQSVKWGWQWIKAHTPPPPPPPKPRVFSKMKVVAALMKAGLWPQVKAWIEQVGLYDLYLAAQNFGEDNEYFEQGLAQLKSQLSLTDEQVEGILAECIAED